MTVGLRDNMLEIVASFIIGVIIKTLYDWTSVVKVKRSDLEEKLKDYFSKFDLNDDDVITLKELIKFIKKG